MYTKSFKFIKWMDLLRKTLTPQFIKYIFTGLLAFVSDYSTSFILLKYISKFFANSAGMLVGFLISFFINKFWSFNSKGELGTQFIRYSILFAINLVISNILIYLLSDILTISTKLSLLFIKLLIILWNYFIFKNIIYKNKNLKEK